MNMETDGNQQPVHWLPELIRHRDSIGDAGIRIKDLQRELGREIRIEGAENIPHDGPVIAVADHIVRMSKPETYDGPYVIEDLFATVGVITEEFRKARSPGTEVFWTPGNIPGKNALYPSNGGIKDVLNWVARGGAKMTATNAVVRPMFFRLFKHASDVLRVPKKNESPVRFMRTVISRIKQGGVLGIFPEGESSEKLKPVEHGASWLARKTGASIVPIAQFNDNGNLIARFGKPIPPPDDLITDQEYMDLVMTEIALMLPPHLRGVFAEKAQAREHTNR